jgi:Lon protease-like protein
VLVEITDTNVTQPGLFDLRCLAKQKIMVQSASQQEDGLWLGQVKLLASEADIPLPKDIIAPKVYFEHLTKSLDEEAHTEEPSPFQTPHQLDNGTWLANRWSEILSIPLDEKQSLLVLDSPLTRLTLINEMLTQDEADLSSFN